MDSAKIRAAPERIGVGSALNPSKFADVKISRGDRIRIRTPGGGRYGDPEDRDEKQVHEDIAEGFISLESAREDYGVEVDETEVRSSADRTR